MNRRSLIRNYVANLIADSLDVSVFKSRRMPLQEMELPAVIVSIDQEESELFSQIPHDVRKTADLSIEIVACDDRDQNSDDLIDELTAKIEELLHTDESFHNVIDRCVLKKTETHYVREGELEQSFARMLFSVTYNATPPTSGDLADFTGAKIHFEKEVK